MAYAQRMLSRNRTLAMVTVAGLHGMALYGLVTGLGVEYVEKYVPTLTGGNTPIDPPPPPPEPSPQASETVHRPSHATAMLPPIDFIDRRDTRIVTPALPPILDPDLSLDPDRLIKPVIEPTGLTSRVALKLALPRNDPSAWVSTDDYPAGALRRSEQGLVRFELAIGSGGKVEGCRITGSSGSADLDAATCRNVGRRARFEAATDGTGARVAGTYSGTIRWVIPTD